MHCKVIEVINDPYGENIRDEKTPAVFMRMPHITVNIRKDAMTAPGSYDTISSVGGGNHELTT